jgi:hypothetical protein
LLTINAKSHMSNTMLAISRMDHVPKEMERALEERACERRMERRVARAAVIMQKISTTLVKVLLVGQLREKVHE